MTFTCAWCFIANSTLLNIEWPDGNSQYYGTIVNSTLLRINGTFPDTRYFSFELYNTETWEPFWDIHDAEINAMMNPYADPDAVYNSSLGYQVDINVDQIHQTYNKTANTSTENAYYLLIYRLYMGINTTGGVSLPQLSASNNMKWETIDPCAEINRPTIDIQNTTPQYSLYKSNENNNFYPPQDKSNLFINYDARYMIAFYNNSNTTFTGAKIKLKVPIYPTSMYHIAKGNYEVRYFSMSIVNLSSPRQTTQTINDVSMYNNSLDNDEVHLYLFCHDFGNVSLQLFPPSTTDHNCSSETEYFGVLYRQLLPQFNNEIPDRPNANQAELMKWMGDYYPEIMWF